MLRTQQVTHSTPFPANTMTKNMNITITIDYYYYYYLEGVAGCGHPVASTPKP